ncbi:hypothetical protein ASF87_06610 [Microbacterium sp. Leaf161]|uniref:hypothetical protein n=1 Tax=Microbacterium sp. Leaf161 TaxID=1736281 RepID=UPI0006FB5E59|nr:hypothetical protein [Microbacterium sp. Leaf161]KQR48545.1 hypothetical protein ASF87_06610 [Microbacterium sp. Leaf161]
MTRAWVRELAGWLGAAAVSLVTAGEVASSARADLLFRDGDSMVVAMLARSLLSGEPLDWAMSSVLFLPESAAFTALDAAVPVDASGLFAISAVVNLLALYGAIRLTAGRARAGMAPVAWSVLALAVFGVLAMTDVSASREALDLASLQLTTTYYSATVVAAVLTIGIVRRMIDSRALMAWPSIGLGVVALVSTLSNPLYAVWATIPLVTLLAIASVSTGLRSRAPVIIAVLLAGTTLGFLSRIPLAAWITKTGVDYIQPGQWHESIDYYGRLVGERMQSPLGVIGLLIAAALIVAAVVRTVRAGDPGSRLVAAMAWVAPVMVVVGAVMLGTHAARYLQPFAFAPVLALVAAPHPLRVGDRVRRPVAAMVGVLLLVAGGLSIPRLADAATRPDADLACVTDWVDASGRTGAGPFWTVRLPKLHLADPSQLVQVDHQLNAYAWLVDRTDFAVGEVSFLVEDSQTVPWDPPQAVLPERVVDCGRYSILDLGTETLPLGPQRS